MDALPPDPYQALGVANDATAGDIKTQYRKLVLKCHPDKVDDSLKVEAADKFHKIQTAWEVIGNEVRRKRYDTQCQLEALRKETMLAREGAGRGGVDIRTASYRMPTENGRSDFYARGPERYARASPPQESYFEPQYEERRPAYAQQEDYFDQQPRPTSRKHDEFERAAKRSSPKDERPKPKTSTRDAKENERSSRKDKNRRTEKDVRRDRDRKAAYVSVEDADSDSGDAYEQRARLRAEDAARLAQEKARFEQMARSHASVETGAYMNERARKTMDATKEAYAHINMNRANSGSAPMRPETVERRPSPVRMASSRDKVESLKRAARPAVQVRRGSGPIKPTRHESKSGSDRERDDYVEEQPEQSRRSGVRHVRRAPTLDKSTSAPPPEPRPTYERQRSYSVQEDHFDQAPPPMKRSETMPTGMAAAPSRDSRGRKEGSKLRPQDSYATPEPTPEAEARPAKYQYGRAYADDLEYATPDGYHTEYREPSDRRIHHSPEPMKSRSQERERQRSASSKKVPTPQPPPNNRTTSTRYQYTPATASRENSYSSSRPPPSREDSGQLYGEVRPGPSPRSSYAPEKISTSRSFTQEDVKFQTGYTSRKPDRPSSSRQYSTRQRQEVY